MNKRCRSMNAWIAPSILSADFARLGAEVQAVLAAGADLIHFDVMDNHYVPNLTIGPLVCEALRKHGITAPIDVHLMVKPVDRIVPDFAQAGATWITFHPEASEHVDRTHRADPRARLPARPGVQPGDAAQLARPRDPQDRHGADHVGEPGLRRPEVHPGGARQAAPGARAHPRQRARDPAGDRRRREGGQHRGDRARRRRHVRGGLGDLRREGLRRDDRGDAGRNRKGQGRRARA